MKKYHTVIGTGPLGLALIEELLLKGYNVKAVNRSTPSELPLEVPFIQCDILNMEETKKAVEDAAVVYHCIGLPYDYWATDYPTIMQNLISLAEQYLFKIVYADNLYAYGPQNKPLVENMICRPNGIKTQVRADVATQLMNAAKNGKITATIGRGADFFGPRVKNATLGQRVFQHLLQDKPVELLGNPNKLHAHIYINDFAKGLVILGEEQRANNEVWHIPHPHPVTTKQLVEEAASQLKVKPKYKIANKLLVSFIGLFNPEMKHFKELTYQTCVDFIVCSDKFKQTFIFENTDYTQAINETLSWYRNHPRTLS